VRGYVEWLKGSGVAIQADARVTGFRREHGNVREVTTTDGTVSVSHVVIAAGAHSGRVAALTGVRVPLEAGKGYSVTIEATASSPRRPLYCTEARVGCSPFEGALRILGTMELSGINEELVKRRVEALVTAPSRFLKGWDAQAAAAGKPWVGMRPMTPDGLPIIGRAPGTPNVILATGHAMLGVTLAPATGEAVADLVMGSENEALLHPFRADRF
jgi:D-amino-acid dehydrogenase